MKHWQMRRSLALILLLATFLTAAVPFTVSAEEANGGEATTEELYGGRTMDEILDLISGSTYDDYATKNSEEKVVSIERDDPIILTPDSIVKEGDDDFVDDKTGKDRTDADYIIGDSEYFGIDEMVDTFGKVHKDAQMVYTPNSGKITYKVVITEAGMYSIDMLYYPIVSIPQADGSSKVVSTKTTIERMFMIDGELPFNECRYLYIPRCWEYVGTDGKTVLTREGQPDRKDFATEEEFELAYDAWLQSEDYQNWLKTGGAGNYQWDKDIQNNDIRPDRLEAAEWRTYFLRDWLGYTVEPFQFYLSEGIHYLTFEATREPIIIGQVILYGYEQEKAYEQQIEEWRNKGYEEVTGKTSYIIEAESPDRVSDQVLFPGTDRTSCINSPSDPADLLYNISSSGVVGQYMRYNVYVEKEGLYNIMIRFRQNTMAGMFTSRRIRVNGEIPFREASYMRFNYDTRFQNQLLGYDKAVEGGKEGETEFEPCLFMLEEGWNTIELEVVLGDMCQYVYQIADIISIMNSAYEEILKITGTNPDSYRDYGFARLIPGTIADLATIAIRLGEIYDALVETTGATGQHIVTLDTIREMVARMALDEYEIAPNFLTFKNYMTALSNWLYTSLSQPLKVDYIAIQTSDSKVPKAKANFFYAAWYETKAFFASFFKDYNVIGFADDGKEVNYDGTILMWNTTSREDALILRTMIDSTFTPESNLAVNIRYVAQGLQESILAGVGPDVAMMGSGTAVSWGLRNAVSDLAAKNEDGTDKFPGFSELVPKYQEGDATAQDGMTGGFVKPVFDEELRRFTNCTFSPAALEAVTLDGATYAIPTTMNFEMAFYRVDIFAGFSSTDIGIPRTWQELHEVLPALVNQHMTMGMQTSLAGYQMLLYQMGSAMYADDYKRFNQDVTALTAFDELCSLFMDYSLPINYDMTRFRTGEIPVVVANWTTYNTFMGYYELRGLWTMESLMGWEHDYDGDGVTDYIDRSSILNLDGIVIPRGTSSEQNVWQYIKWYTGDDAQTRLARQQLATASNTTIKYNTANLNALLQQAWTDEEFDALVEQIGYLKGIPFNPGDYNIGRYVNFAFLAVYNSKANAVDSLLNYVVDIDKELARKRKEYHLPYIIEKDEANDDASAAE